MRYIYLVWLCLCCVLSAQTNSLTVSPSVVNYRIRSPKIYPGWRYVAPQKQILTVQVPNQKSWAVSLSGPLNSACLYYSACFQVTEEYSNNPVTSGVGPRRVAVNWYGSQGPNLDPNNYSGTVTFTPEGGHPVSVTVNLQVAAAAELPATPEAKETAIMERGCVNTDPLLSYTFAVRCDIPNEAPIVDPALTRPAVGRSFIDPVFGGKITRITGPGCSTEYGTTTAFSANSTYIWNSCGVYRTSDATQVRGPHGNISLTAMSAVDDEVYYYFSGTQIRRFNFVNNDDSVLGDFGGAPYNFHSLYGGGTAPVSEDDWLAFYDYTPGAYPKICATDLVALRAAGAPSPTNTYCIAYQGTQPLTFLDWASVSETDDPTGKRYIYLSSIPLSVVFSVGPSGSGKLKQEYIVPEWPGWARNNDDGVCVAAELCYNANNFTHNALFKDRDGQVMMFGNFEDILLNRNYNSTFRLNAGLQLLRLEEEGGGQRILGRFNWDKQPGCSSRIQGCTVASIESGHRFAARVTQADIANDRTRLTLSAATGWAPYSLHPVRVQNATGSWRCLNGGWTATVLPGSQVEIPAICVGAAGAIDKVMLGDAAQPFTGSDNDNRSQIQIWRPERQIHRVAMHRSVVWSDVPGTGISSYGSTPRASISRDGRFVAFNSNWGALDFDGESVYMVETGLGAPENQITLKEVTPAVNSVAVSYEIADGQACAMELSADPTFQNLVESFMDSAGSISRPTYLGRNVALSPGTDYWLRMQCGMEVESKTFRTLDSDTPASRVLTTQVGPTDDATIMSVVIEYRTAGSALFTATSGQACSAGCQVSWGAEAGTVSEYRVLYLDANTNVKRSSDLCTIAIPR